MADIRCSKCGNNNPDFLDLCQFCQTPLHPDSMLHIGDEPTKKDTGELEEILPSWLKDARKQSKEETGGDATLRSETRPRLQKSEAPDLLAGLISQAADDDDDVPSWLAGINPVADKEPSKKEAGPSDFFAQFAQTELKPSTPAVSESEDDDMPAWMKGMERPASAFKDDLTDLPLQEPAETSAPAFDDNSWMNNLGSSFDESSQLPAEQTPENLSWLHDLENSAKQPSSSPSSQDNVGFDFAPASSGDDLSWLNNLGGLNAPSFEQPASQPTEGLSTSSQEDLSWLDSMGGVPAQAFEKPAQPAEDLSWLNNLGGTSAPAFEEPSQPSSSQEDLSWLDNLGGGSASAFAEPAQPQPASSQEDLSWLNNLGGMSSAPAFEESSQPSSSQEDLNWLDSLSGNAASAFEEPAQPASSQEDLNWLNALGGASAPVFEEPSQSSSSQEDMSWLNNLGGTDFEQPSAFASQQSQTPETTSSKPFQTAPLNELLNDNEIKDINPDWLKSALQEEPSMPSLEDLSTGRSAGQTKSSDERPASSPPAPASPSSAFDLPFGGSSSTPAQDVDSLFNIDMPDWLSNETEGTGANQSSNVGAASASTDESLAPVELPSWVQAMRPVGSSIDDAVSASTNLVTENEGPLAGFKGVIPSAPIGSAIRPKAFSLKLQVTDEQQSGAALLEQIIAGETVARLQKSKSVVSSQSILRWGLSGVFLFMLTVVIGLGLKTMPIVPSNQLSDLVATIPDSAPVLVVIDYEPSLAGELEATGGPLLDQLALTRRATFSFVSMSPTGSALVDRLMNTIKLTKPAPEGLGYQLGNQYINNGFLPGGSAGVLRFMEDPADDFARFGAIILMTDNAEAGRVWVEQFELVKVRHPELAGKRLFIVSSAQSGPMLQLYASSGQASIVINGLYDAARYEYVNTSRPGIVRGYWDAFGVGLFMAIVATVLGSTWNVLAGIRERRAKAEAG